MKIRTHVGLLSIACVCGITLTGVASAQSHLGLPSWDETVNGGGDAGIQSAAQVTTGNAAMTTISGTLNQGGGDHVDCYLITVEDPDQFYATTDPAIDPLAVVGETDTRLWLWNASGTTIISVNDDTPDLCAGGDSPGLLSYIAETTSACAPGNDPRTYVVAPVNPVTTALVAGTDYVLCYSYFPNDPDAAAGDMAPIGTAFEALNGPNPAATPFTAYENTGTDAQASYTIALRGVGSSDVPVELMSFGVE
jgi:hypothetical protein